MLYARLSLNGMVTAPHHLAAQAGLEVLREGGNAVEAAVATAAALAVVYPHMNSLGGDGFWLIAEPGKPPIAIDACGPAAAAADLALYHGHGLDAVPWRGPLAANTSAGAVAGWAKALEVSAGWGGRLPLSRLLGPAALHAREGVVVTPGMSETIAAKRHELEGLEGFAKVFLPGGATPATGDRLRQPALAETLDRLARHGLADFHRGGLAEDLAADLQALGSPVSLADLSAQAATILRPLEVETSWGRLYNQPPPTQGLSSLMILALFDRLEVTRADGFEHVHGLVEATKRAFRIRDREVGDPAYMTLDPQALLDDGGGLDRLAAGIDPAQAMPWPEPSQAGDTVWFGVIDGQGRAASLIQSTYFEFGSGLVLPRTGVTWQNRGASFRLTEGGWNALKPGRKPFHTLNPAMARLKDGRTMVYGNMGGEGQPQSQAAVFTRYAAFGQDLQQAITAPRWLLGRTWGEESTSLKIEDRFPDQVVSQLIRAGHVVERLAPFTSTMGHAGAVVHRPDGVFEGASDPRSDGAAAGF